METPRLGSFSLTIPCRISDILCRSSNLAPARILAHPVFMPVRFFRLPLILIATWSCLTQLQSAFGANDPRSCSANADGRQLDYWLGEWRVSPPGAQGNGTSNVHLSLDKCLIVESWDGGKGHTGENVFAYSSEEKIWHGLFADNYGRVHVFRGRVTHGSAEFEGPSPGPNGNTILNRVKVVRIAENKVEQSWEKSGDNGLTWTLEFRGEYLRK